jgi:hypothetical protein
MKIISLHTARDLGIRFQLLGRFVIVASLYVAMPQNVALAAKYLTILSKCRNRH